MDAEHSESPPASRDLPPLRLHHLFAATTVTAVTLVVMKLGIGGTRYADYWLSGSAPAYLAIQALAVYCVFLGILWRRRGMAFPSEPGHGILLGHSAGFFFYLGYLLLYDIRYGGSSYDWPFVAEALLGIVGWLFTELGYSGLLLFCAILDLWCARKLADSRRWVLYFRLSAAAHTGILLMTLFSQLLHYSGAAQVGGVLSWVHRGVVYGVPLAMATVLALVAYRDLLKKIKRHWTHWFGVGSTFLFLALWVLQLVKEALYPTDWSAY